VRAEMQLSEEQLEVNGHLPRNEDGSVDVHVRVTCSAGTYVRTLAHDVGSRLGCGAHLATLRRTRVGRFSIDDAVTLEALEGHVAERILAPSDLVAGLPAMRLDDSDEDRARHGMPLPGIEVAMANADPVALVDARGGLVGIARFDAESGLLKPRIILPVDSG
jgi:tRNA pseudouridine55 synthase